MADPYAPTRHKVMNERRAAVDALAERLGMLGASQTDVDVFLEAWAPATEDDRRDLATLDDESLLRFLAVARGDVPLDRPPMVVEQNPQAVVVGVHGEDPQTVVVTSDVVGAVIPSGTTVETSSPLLLDG